MTRIGLSLLVLALLGLLLASAAAAAPKGGGMEFAPPAKPPTTPDPRKPVSPGSTFPTDDPIQDELEQLRSWPDKKGVRAAESLLLRGPEVVPYLVQMLNAESSSYQPGAAWVLGHLGEPAHIQVILRAAAKRRTGGRSRAFFEAAWNLDAAKTKHWLFSFLTLKRPVFRQKATEFLMQHVDASDQRRVLNLLDAETSAVRIAGLRLLEPAKVEDASERLLQALADLAPEVARQASVLLALSADDAMIVRLNETAVEGTPRERAYATLALVEVYRTRNENPFTRETLTELAGRRGLLHPERLPRGAAAVGLAYGAQDANDPSLQSLLDGMVVDTLIDTVGGRHFRDFSSLADPVFSSLRRLSGLDLPSTAVAWASWWRRERDGFQARRPLSGFEEVDVANAYVRFELVDAQGGRREATFRPAGGTMKRGDFVLQEDVFLALVHAVEAAGIFQAAAMVKPRADEHLVAVLGVANQTRRMVVPASDDRFSLLRMKAMSLFQANRWQRYRDVDRWPNAEAWWKTNVEMLEEAEPSMRRQLLRSAIVHAYDDLPHDDQRAEALDLLEDLIREDEVSGTLSAAETKALVAAATSAVSFGEVEERAVRFALMQQASRRVRADLVEALAGRAEPAAGVLLADLLVTGGRNTVREAFADPRSAMRVAAARAAQVLIDETKVAEPKALGALDAVLRPGLEVLQTDQEPVVAARASVALHRLGDLKAIGRLEEVYNSGNRGVKLAVAEALGDLQAEQAFPLLNLILAEDRAAGSGPLRATALRSLARTGHENSISLLVFYLLNDRDGGVRHAAAEALVELGTDDARFALVRALTEGQPDGERRARLVRVLGQFQGRVVAEVLTAYLEDRNPMVSYEAAISLAKLNDASAFPYLVDLVRKGKPDQAANAVEGLENLSLQRFKLASHALTAEQYEQWHQGARVTTAKQPDRAWFRAAMRKKGYDIGLLGPYVQGDDDLRAVPVLIRALRDDDPLLRRGAAIALERITQLSQGKVDRTTSGRDAAIVADTWARWWLRVNPEPAKR